MIDFRYHVVSIIAVLLALAIGVMFGSGFVGGRLIDRLGRNQTELQRTNQELREQIRDQEDFVEAVAPWLTQNALLGEDVVVVTFEGTDGTAGDGARSAVEQAGGRIPSTITLTGKLALEAREDRAELGTLLGTSARAPKALRSALGEALGTRLGIAASFEQPRDGVGENPREGLSRLVVALASAGYVAVDAVQEDALVSSGAHFLVVGGGDTAPSYDAGDIAVTLATSVGERGGNVVAAEPLPSTWGIVDEVCADGTAADLVTTVDHADQPQGLIAVVMALDREGGPAGHYGLRSCSTGSLPEPGSPG